MSENRVSREVNACFIRGVRNQASVCVCVTTFSACAVLHVKLKAHFETAADLSVFFKFVFRPKTISLHCFVFMHRTLVAGFYQISQNVPQKKLTLAQLFD